MKLIKVKCPKNKKIEVEDLGTGAARCPEHCPLKQKSRCFNNTFRYTAVLNPAVVVDIPFSAGNGAGVATETQPLPSSTTEQALREPKPSFSTRAHTCERTPRVSVEPFRPDLQGATGTGFQSSVIGYEDPFGESAPTSSTIAYDDPFGVQDTFSQPKPKTSKSTLDKYNDTLLEMSSIFSVVKNRAPDEPCFVDGAYEFYEKPVFGRASSGNASAAIRYIFRHWYVSKVFKEDGKTFQEPFLYLLKLRNFKEKEGELKTIAEDVTLDVNRKFFRLFYTVIYKNQINVFYWNDGDSSLREIAPRFLDKNDFYKKLSSSRNPTEFLTSFEECFDELIYFLLSGADVEHGREWFKKNIPLMMAEGQDNITFIDETDGHFSLLNLGSVRSFVESLKKPDSMENMSNKYRFLRDFKITVNYKVLPRETPLPLLKAQTMEDDSIYKTIKLSKNLSSQCATAYNYYTTLFKEYLDTFRPEDVLIGECCFSCRNFYFELVDLITDACAHLTESYENASTYPEVQRLYLVQSLFSRGVFEYFESRCETDRLDKLKKVFMGSTRIDLTTYFRFDGIKHWISEHGQRKSISAYLQEIVKDRSGRDILGRMGEDKVAKAYFTARIDPADWKVVKQELDSLTAEQEKLLQDF